MMLANHDNGDLLIIVDNSDNEKLLKIAWTIVLLLIGNKTDAELRN